MKWISYDMDGRKKNWYPWFAWYPVFVTGKQWHGDKKRVWLEWVERKEDDYHGWFREIGSDEEYCYLKPTDVEGG